MEMRGNEENEWTDSSGGKSNGLGGGGGEEEEEAKKIAQKLDEDTGVADMRDN